MGSRVALREERKYERKQKSGKGLRAFPTEQDFQSKFLEYMGMCREMNRLATVSGFSVFCDITRETFYQQEVYYPDTYEKIQMALEDETVNAKNTIMGIFVLKNKFGYVDKPEVEINNFYNLEVSNDELVKRLEKSGFAQLTGNNE